MEIGRKDFLWAKARMDKVFCTIVFKKKKKADSNPPPLKGQLNSAKLLAKEAKIGQLY